MQHMLDAQPDEPRIQTLERKRGIAQRGDVGAERRHEAQHAAVQTAMRIHEIANRFGARA